MLRKILRTPFALIAGVSALLCSIQAIAAHVDDTLASKYKGKQVMLRNFYCGQELKFDMQGKLLSGGVSGAWTLCRDIRIEGLQLKTGKLEIAGQRIYLIYDQQQKRFRDVTEVADKKKEGFKKLVKDQKVSIQVEIPPNSDDQSIQNTMDMIFYPSEKQFREAVPAFWKPFFQNPHQQAAQATDHAGSEGENSVVGADDERGKVNHVGNGVSAPTPVYSPDPDYSEAARQGRSQGTVVMTVVVGPDGRVRKPVIQRCLGMGLDDKAVEKVLAWKFKPATRNGQPVAVEVSVEVQFNLY